MANQFLASFKFGAEDDAKEEVCRTAVAKICVKVHTSINETGEKFFNELRRKTYTTPKSYLDLIGMYSSKLGELQGQVDVKIEQMEVGCAKLAETNAVVDGTTSASHVGAFTPSTRLVSRRGGRSDRVERPRRAAQV